MEKQIVYFKHPRPKEMRTEGKLLSLIIQALRYLGKDEVGPEIINRLRTRLSSAEKGVTRSPTARIIELACSL